MYIYYKMYIHTYIYIYIYTHVYIIRTHAAFAPAAARRRARGLRPTRPPPRRRYSNRNK